ncbi:MAG: signal peptidase II [Opitutae bacterium]|nr:signal peptidase II [Opitutae bacterium]
MTPLLVALCVILLDQAAKEWVRGAFALHESVPLIPGFFSLTYIRNTGAAWGMFSGQNLALSLLAFAMLVALVLFRRKILPPGKPHRVALGLLCGGIVGNLFDRLRLDYVVDYLDFHFRTSHFPAFNVADASICVGVGIYILGTLLAKPPAPLPPCWNSPEKPAP